MSSSHVPSWHSATRYAIISLMCANFGTYVKGVDVAAETGTPILAADKGTVTFAGWNGG